jgi:hypothetical protein
VAQATAGSVGAVYIYHRKSEPWVLTGNITVGGSTEFQNFGQCAAVRGRSLAAIYGSNTVVHQSQIVIMRADSSGKWAVTQVIDLGNNDVSDTGITFCQNPEANYLAAALSKAPAVLIYTENKNSGKFEFLQKVVDPQVSAEGVTIPYEEQHVQFASDFAWEVGQCNRFVIGAMSKYDGPDGAPLPYGRVYIFALNTQPPDKESGNVLAIVLGVVGGILVLAGIAVAVIYLRRKKVFSFDGAQEPLLIGGELSTTSE